jgi:predicted transcriptional regulator
MMHIVHIKRISHKQPASANAEQYLISAKRAHLLARKHKLNCDETDPQRFEQLQLQRAQSLRGLYGTSSYPCLSQRS